MKTTKKIVNKMIKEQTGYSIEIEKWDGFYCFVDNSELGSEDYTKNLIIGYFDETCTYFTDLNIDPYRFVESIQSKIDDCVELYNQHMEEILAPGYDPEAPIKLSYRTLT